MHADLYLYSGSIMLSRENVSEADTFQRRFIFPKRQK